MAAVPAASRDASSLTASLLASWSSEKLVLALVVVFIGFLSIVPIGRLLAEAFFIGGVPSLNAFSEVFAQPATWRALRHTLETSLGGTLVAVVIGTLMALLVALTNVRGKLLLVFCLMLPMMIPPQVMALSWIGLTEPGGLFMRTTGIGAWFDMNPLYSVGGIILVLGVQSAPVVFLTLRAGLRAMPADLVEAAQASSAGRARVIRDVVLPLMTPALLSGASLAFIAAVGNFGIPALLGMPVRYNTLPVLIYRKLSGFGPTVLGEVAVLSVLLAVIAVVFIGLQARLLSRRDYRATGTSATLLPYDLGRWRFPAECFGWLLIFATLILPLSALLLNSLTPAYGIELTPANLTLDHYRYVLFIDSVTRQAFTNSFFLAAGAATVLVLLAIVFGFFLVWRPHWLLRTLNSLADLPYALPGTVVSIACILVFIQPIPFTQISIYNTIWIIFAAYLVRFMTRAIRPIVNSYHAIDRALDEAGAMCGASLLVRMRTIVLPLIAPTAFAAAMIVFLAAFNELTISILLWSAGTETVGVMVFNLKQAGDVLEASAMSCLTILLTVTLMAMLSAFGRHLPSGVIPWRV